MDRTEGEGKETEKLWGLRGGEEEDFGEVKMVKERLFNDTRGLCIL